MEIQITETGVAGYDFEWRIDDVFGYTVARGFTLDRAAAASAAAARLVAERGS